MKKQILLITILLLAAALRLWGLNSHPAGLNADEAALGYNAYSLIQTGRDEHGAAFPLAFRSFDDYKPGVYVYLVLPFVYFFGLNEWTVRLPSALLGILSVYLVYLLANHLLSGSKKDKVSIGHLASFLLAISPWHLHFSRGGWEVNAATTFLLLGLVFFLGSFKNSKLFLLSAFFWVTSLYTYHSMRVVIPLLALFLLCWRFKEIKTVLINHQAGRFLVGSLLLGFVLLIPLMKQTLSGSTSARFSGVSIFAQSGPLWAANEQRGQHENSQSMSAKILHNQYYNYAIQYFDNISSHYSDPFLFFTGDEIARSKVPGMGQSYLWTLPFFAFGLWFLAKNRPTGWGLILYWFLIGTFAASLTFQSPHALRSQNISIPLQLIIAYGLANVATTIKKYISLKAVIATLALVITFSLVRYLDLYYRHYPRELGYSWQYGFDQLGSYLRDHQASYDRVVISTRYDQPYILTAFYLQYPPSRLQQELVFSKPDEFGFSTGLSFGKFDFHPIEWSTDSRLQNTLIVVADEFVPGTFTPVHTIYYPNGTPVFRIFDTSQYLAKNNHKRSR